MTNEDRQLLLKDLATRLSYGLYATVRDSEENDDFQPFEVLGIKEVLVWVRNTMISVDHFDTIEVVKPYLRPMSSMTEEEKKEFQACHCVYELHPDFQPMMCNLANELNMFDWLNSHHFDYRGLIKKGLALEATEDMYKK